MAVNDHYARMGALEPASANLEVVREAYRQLERGNEEGFLAAFAEDVVGYEADSLPYGGAYPSKEGLRRMMHLMFNSWEKVSWNITELTAGGDLVVIHVIMTFTPRGGKAFDFPVTEVWRFRDGLAIELRPFYWDTKLIADALAAASSNKV